MLADLAEAAAGAGDLDRAQALAQSITNPGRRAERWRTWPGRRRGPVTRTGPRRWRSRPRQQPGRSATRTGRRGCWRIWPGWRRGPVTWTEPRSWPGRSATRPAGGGAGGPGKAAAQAGDLDRAQELAQSISDPDRHARALADLAEAAATRTGRKSWRSCQGGCGAGDQAGAELARSISDPDWQTEALAYLAEAAAGAGDLDRAQDAGPVDQRPGPAGAGAGAPGRGGGGGR